MWCECVCPANQAMVGRIARGRKNSLPMGKNPRRGQKDDHGAPFAQINPVAHLMLEKKILSSSSFKASAFHQKFPISCVDPLPPWTPALVALECRLYTLHLPITRIYLIYAPPARQIYTLPRRLAPPIEQLGKFQIERWQLFGTTLLDLTAMGEGV